MAGPAAGSSAKGAASYNLFLRIISAIVLAALALALAWFGGPLFALFWAAAAFAVWWEWLRLVQGSSPRCLAIGFFALGIIALLVMGDHAAFACLVLLVGVVVVWIAASRNAVWTAAGVVYAGILVIAPALLRGDDAIGRLAILFLFAVVWATDILAYFVGRAIGGPKLAPSISPNKTWSGAVGGTIAAVAGGIAVVSAFGGAVTSGLVLVAIVLSAVSQGGDLFESRLKRLFEVKDSSALIPGHGGVMDRLDGFIVAAAAALLIGLARGGWGAPANGLMAW